MQLRGVINHRNKMTQTFSFTTIGEIRSPYKEKFSVPRQPNLVKMGTGELHLYSPYNNQDAVRGLEQFSHLWLLFFFHHIPQKNWKTTVRPPRLGGNIRMGVFATRSMFRPNPIGLSLVELHDIITLDNQVILKLGSVDLVDGTPILDIKPYLPFIESQPEAKAGFAQHAPTALLNVIFSPHAIQSINALNTHYPNLQQLIEQVLAQDPRPAYHKNKDSQRCYANFLFDLNITWQVKQDNVLVIAINKQ